MSSTKFIALAVVSVAVIAAPAFASDTVHFKFNAYELETEAGAKNVYERMNRKATRVCRADFKNAGANQREDACVSRLVESWVSNARSARLGRLHTNQDDGSNYAY